MVDKQKVLLDAISVLNNDNQPWQVQVDGDSIIASWKWMDARFFSPTDITDEIKEYIFKVTLDDKGRWHELDYQKESNKGINSKGFSMGTSMFYGKTVNKSITIGFGKDKQNDNAGVITSKFDTSKLKDPIRSYLKQYGWKKAGLF